MGENRITRRQNVSLSALTQKSKTKQCREQQNRKSVLRVQRDAAQQMCQTGIFTCLEFRNWKYLRVRRVLSAWTGAICPENPGILKLASTTSLGELPPEESRWKNRSLDAPE